MQKKLTKEEKKQLEYMDKYHRKSGVTCNWCYAETVYWFDDIPTKYVICPKCGHTGEKTWRHWLR